MTIKAQLVALCLAVAVCGLSGCKRGKPHGRADMIVPRKVARPAMSNVSAYNRYYAMWWIAHSNLETTIRSEWNLSKIDHTFDQAARNLQLMNKFLGDKKKAKVEKFINVYEDLRRTSNPGRPSRHTMARLDRVEIQIKKCLSPANVKLLESKDVSK